MVTGTAEGGCATQFPAYGRGCKERQPAPAARHSYLKAVPKEQHGNEIEIAQVVEQFEEPVAFEVRAEGKQGSADRNAAPEEGRAQEPQASHRHRTVKGAARGRQGPS